MNLNLSCRFDIVTKTGKDPLILNYSFLLFKRFLIREKLEKWIIYFKIK